MYMLRMWHTIHKFGVCSSHKMSYFYSWKHLKMMSTQHHFSSNNQTVLHFCDKWCLFSKTYESFESEKVYMLGVLWMYMYFFAFSLMCWWCLTLLSHMLQALVSVVWDQWSIAKSIFMSSFEKDEMAHLFWFLMIQWMLLNELVYKSTLRSWNLDLLSSWIYQAGPI